MSGIQTVRTYYILNKVEWLDGSTIVEAAVELGVRIVASEDIFCKRRSLSCYCIWSKAHLVDGVLNYLWLR